MAIPDGGTVGEKAKRELFEIRHLSVGSEAPDTEGDDQDGKHFKVADYLGEVVLLDFWSQVQSRNETGSRSVISRAGPPFPA